MTAPNYPNLENLAQAIGFLQVAINPLAGLKSRDGGSPPAITEYEHHRDALCCVFYSFAELCHRSVYILDNWGDIPQDLVLSVNGPSLLGIYWTTPISRALPPLRYRCQVSLDGSFSGPFARIIENIIPQSASLVFPRSRGAC